ncbi:glycine betaine/choline ABC transporter membrane protein [Klebsiella pneumoniae subsp. ozaenae]|uniref:Glycine betaine/choline ABC transporter membrane protein n=1 Tax=Klebsiella pneumoniae subsp. ozaenae TaxID=574 RepID=A0A377ZAZ5_KLEPO|nr:glycine betaine/choline ABC transporter membrane protein [Klebsiella pneumoniae subsp. ozaenae]
MKMATTWSGALALAALISLPLQAAEPVKVGSKIDTEGALLGNMIQQVLESHGVKTINKIQLGTTPGGARGDCRRRAGYLPGIYRQWRLLLQR